MHHRRTILLTLATGLGLALSASGAHAAVEGAKDGFQIRDAIAGSWRGAQDKARDAHRHPREVLEFFDLAPGMTVVEVSPGRGWYTQILAPYVNRTGGTFIAAGFDPEDEREFAQRGRLAFQKEFLDQPDTYGAIQSTVMSATSPGIAPDGSADLVVTFRNVHNWVPGGYAEKAFADIFRALKPGGILGVVDHRLPADREADAKLSTGYIHESAVQELAEAAGFVFEESSAVNYNPADTTDHPFGVWTLPPVARTSSFGEPDDLGFDRAPYDAIGESDRFTLRFRKPSR